MTTTGTRTTVRTSVTPVHPGAASETVGHQLPLDPQRLRRAKKSYTTRDVTIAVDAHPEGHHLLTGPDVAPRPGDVVLARVLELGQHRRLEGPGSRRQTLFPGQEILVAYGNRYAPDQFLAEVPADLSSCHLAAAGGVAGVVTAQHDTVADPTVIEPVGLLADNQGRVTLARYAPYEISTAPKQRPGHWPLVVTVLGTSMNSGKSTVLASLVNGLTNAGLVVSAGKATGTGAGNDVNLFRDSGAARVLDFTDFGLPSTFGLGHDEVRDVWASLVDALTLDGPDVVVVEIADGVYQGETARLLADRRFGDAVDRVLFAAQDALGAAGGVGMLRSHSLPVVAVSGVLTASPLAGVEARRVLPVEVIDTVDLCDPRVATELLLVSEEVA